jgi:hydroxymethylpyrimidine kinase/phosphomethylpyrimidine kinase
MLASAKVAAAVADFLASAGLPNVVLDPVLKASSGADLLNPAGLDVLRERLLPLATLITPNSDEAACLIGLPVSSLDQMKTAAQRLHTMGARNVVVTGGHLPGATDLLSTESGTQEVLAGKRLRSASTHGTGCAFATALACNLALGEELSAAARHAKSFVSTAIQEAYPVGKGTGPINHLYRLKR